LPQDGYHGGLAAVQAGIPWIATERTAGIFYADIPVVARVRLFLGRFATAVVANSEVGERYWRENGAPTIKLSTIRNALDLEASNAQPGTIPSFHPTLFPGSRPPHRDKAVEIIVRAIAKPA